MIYLKALKLVASQKSSFLSCYGRRDLICIFYDNQVDKK